MNGGDCRGRGRGHHIFDPWAHRSRGRGDENASASVIGDVCLCGDGGKHRYRSRKTGRRYRIRTHSCLRNVLLEVVSGFVEALAVRLRIHSAVVTDTVVVVRMVVYVDTVD